VKVKYYLIFIFLLFAIPVYGESPHSIHWKKIEAASGYSVEIRTEANKSIFRNTTEPSVTVLLAVGKYTYRIGIYNKLKRIAKWSDWYELEVRPLRPPVVTEQASDFETDGNKRKLTFSGENIFEGTSAYVIQDGKKIPAEVTTSRDRKTSVVSVDANMVDINKDYKVVLVNPNFESIEVPLIEKENEITEDTQKHSPNVSDAMKDKTKHTGSFRLWPLLWRQAILPGWGNYYLGDHLAAYGYWSILGVSSIYAGYEYKEYVSLNNDLKEHRESMKTIRAFDPDGLAFPFFANTFYENKLTDSVTQKGDTINQALTIVGAVYVTSIIHIIYLGVTKKPEHTSKQTYNIQIKPDQIPNQERRTEINHSRIDFSINFYF